MKFPRLRLIRRLLIALALMASVQPAMLKAQTVEAPPASAPVAPLTAPAGGRVDLDYRLGPGDKVRIIVFGEESLTGEFFVGSTGVISLPLIGDLRVLDQTAGQVQLAIQNALKDGYINDPRVSLEVLSYRPFYILGEVNKPGTYPYTSGLTVMNAVATAQGFTYRANTRKVFIKRATESTEREIPLSTEVTVQPGDTIRIVERFF